MYYNSCISFDSYIKPQLNERGCALRKVVYLLIPTSNHNMECYDLEHSYVVYLLIPTSNHNMRQGVPRCTKVVYLLIPTSNHNCSNCVATCCGLYIF